MIFQEYIDAILFTALGSWLGLCHAPWWLWGPILALGVWAFLHQRRLDRKARMRYYQTRSALPTRRGAGRVV